MEMNLTKEQLEKIKAEIDKRIMVLYNCIMDYQMQANKIDAELKKLEPEKKEEKPAESKPA